ncbi:motility-associated ABC transporter substrate-binding family protein [Novosphingobium aquimarinum]|uniref:ABC transporter n=1 Tax=Novosphingobium aquimarinum TaxID=2682494 RepID=UPI0018DB0A9E|nr:ABC transporter [Novosphingobium aquimarinum]
MASGSRSESRIVALHTSLPIVWRESGAISDLLDGGQAPHWVLAALREEGKVVPLDTLAGARGLQALPRNSLLVLAQPRALSPQDNVALDDWVRQGGHVLLFADPMLTGHSDYALGDPRRPQDIALLSPILGHWGLELRFDEDQQGGKSAVAWRGRQVPVNLHGAWNATSGACALEAKALIARCTVGSGSVLAVADAAVLEDSAESADSDAAGALATLLKAASAPGSAAFSRKFGMAWDRLFSSVDLVGMAARGADPPRVRARKVA